MKRILPGNYFLTKSMDWAIKTFKIVDRNEKLELEDYWHLKKFLVYYYHMFSVKNSLETIEVFKKIEENFTKFIHSLDMSEQKNAERYFFYRDIRNLKEIVTWNEFYDVTKQPLEKNELYKYKDRARKIYWMYLMGIGGQSGENALILHQWIPNGVKYHEISDKLIKECDYSEKEVSQRLNDVWSALRNIRQLCFYYGILYRRDNSRVEEYSLTTVGQLIVESNIREVAIIMEHQKIRMISQPPNAQIKNVKNIAEFKSFFIDINPYIKILKYLKKYKEMSLKEYQYKISRNVPLESDTAELQRYIEGFSRAADNKKEDFTKEIKKYLHGLSLIKDAAVYFTKSSWHASEDISSYYNYIKFYKNIKKKILKRDITRFRKLLLNNYKKGRNVDNYHELKEWYIYISTFDRALLYSLLIYNWSNNRKDYINIIKYLNIDGALIQKSLKEKEEGSSGLQIYKTYINVFSVNLIEEAELESKKFNIQSTDTLIKEADRRFNIVDSKDRKQISIIKSFYIKANIDTCDCCGQKTFKTQKNIPYLEYHHLVPLSQEGTDHILNLFGICPMCHRKFHFSKDTERKNLYRNLNQNDNLVKIDSDSFTLYERYNYLYANGHISLLGLEFLLDEGAFTDEQLEEIIRNKG